ncbi:MAG: DUF2341 domain-containing protein, partial [Candidatus Peribacteraceae bacterium]
GAASGDSDISAIYSVAGGNVTVASGKELMVWTGDAYAPGGTVAATDYDINGNFQMSANAVSVGGNWDATHGTATGSNTVTFTATSGTKTITSSGGKFTNLTLNGNGGTFSPADDLSLDGDLTVTAGTLTGDVDVEVRGGDATGNGTINLTNGTFRLLGTGNFGGATDWSFNHLVFGNGEEAGTTSKSGANTVTATNQLEISLNHTLNAGTGTWNLQWGSNEIFDFKEIVAGGLFNLALKSDGSRVYAWGNNQYGQLGDGTTMQHSTPVAVLGPGGQGYLGEGENGPISAIAAGYDHALALKSDGSRVYAWGHNDEGALGQNSNDDNPHFFPLAVLGVGGTGSLGDGTNGGPISAIAAGMSTAYAVKSDGSRVYAWGYNYYGQIGDNSSTNRYVPVEVHGLLNTGYLGDGTNGGPISAVAAGAYHTLALKSDGSRVYAWGYNYDGELGQNTGGEDTPNPLPLEVLGLGGTGKLGDGTNGGPISAIDAGHYHNLALKSDGTRVYAWGYNTYGQAGDDSYYDQAVPIAVPGLGDTGSLGDGTNGGPISAIDAGYHRSLALKSDGSAVYSWGNNTYGELGNSTAPLAKRAIPAPVYGLTGTGSALGEGGASGGPVSAISAGMYHNIALKQDGTRVYAWGLNMDGQLGQPYFSSGFIPRAVQNIPEVRSIALMDVSQIVSGTNYSLALKSDGTRLYAWGYNASGQLGQNTADGVFHPFPLAVRGVGGTGFLGDGTNGGPISAIAMGRQHALALKSDGTRVYAWGLNNSAQLGQNDNTDRWVPVAVLGVAGTGFLGDGTNGGPVSAVSAGAATSFALKNDGTRVYAWGSNTNGKLGDGSTTSRKVPVLVKGVGNTGYLGDGTNGGPISAIAAGYTHTLALKSDGTRVYGWGWNYYGDVGDGTNTQRTSPVLVKGVGNTGNLGDGTNGGPISAIAAGDYLSLALKSDGSRVYAWGDNAYGQLGQGTTTDSNYPVVVRGLTDTGSILGDGGASGGPVSAIAASNHALALKSDGSRVYAWGWNREGQLGDGSYANRYHPVEVVGVGGAGKLGDGGAGGGPVSSIKGSGYNSVALKSGGSRVYLWGDGEYGANGNGSRGESTLPVEAAYPAAMPLVVRGTWTPETSTVLLTDDYRYDASSPAYTLIENVTYNNLTLNNSAEVFALSGATTVNGNLTLTAGTLDVTAASPTLTVGGNWTNTGTGTFLAHSGSLVLSGAGTQTVNSGGTGTGKTFWAIRQTGAGTVRLAGNDLLLGSGLTLLAGAGTFDNATNDKNITVRGDVTMDNTRTDLGDGTWTVGGSMDFEHVGTWNRNSSTTIMTGSGTLMTKTAAYLHNFTVGTGASISDRSTTTGAAGTVTINGTLTIADDKQFRCLNDCHTAIGATGRITGAGQFWLFSPGSGVGITSFAEGGVFDVAYFNIYKPGAAAIALASGKYNSILRVSNEDQASTLRLPSGNFIIGGNASFNAQSNTLVIDNVNNPAITFLGDVIVTETSSTLTWTKGTGTITLSGATAQSVNLLGKSVEDVVINKTHGTVQLTGTGTLDSLLVSSGTIDFNGKAITTVGGLTIGATGQVNPAGLPGSSLIVGGNLSLTGEAGDLLNLSATGSWTLNVTGTATASYATVKGGDASAGATVSAKTSVTDQGYNKNWDFDVSGWSNVRAITVSHEYVDEDLHDFPLLVRLTSDASLAENAQSSGADIRFATSTGMLLPYEREDYHVRASSGSGLFWVKVPTIHSAQDTTIYLYYGNAATGDGQWKEGVWTNGFEGVWHLNGNVQDSLAQNNGIDHGTSAVAGLAGGARQFTSSQSDYIDLQDPASLQPSQITYSLWFNTTAAQTQRMLRKRLYGYELATTSTGNVLNGLWESSANNLQSATPVSYNDGAWHYAAVTYDTVAKLYVDDAAPLSDEDINSGNIYYAAGGIALGRDGNSAGSYYSGSLDEVRISSVARTAAWLKFEYRNMLGEEATVAESSGMVTGKLYSDEGSTPLAGKTVSVSVNGQAVAASDDTDANGQYVLENLSLTGGNVLTFFTDDETEDAVTVVLSSGINMAGINLYQNRLIVRSESGSAAVTNTHLDTANNSGDSDISALYDVTGGNLTVASGKELLVWTGDTYAPGGEVTTTDLDVNGTMAMGANAYTISGNFDAVANAFSATGTGTFTATTTGKSITATGSTLGKVKFDGTGGGWTLQSNLTMSSATILAGNVVDNGKTVRVDGNINVANISGILISTGIWEMSGNGTLANAGITNPFEAFRVADGVTTTLVNHMYTRKLTVGTASTLTGYYGVVLYNSTQNDPLDMVVGSSTINITALSLYPYTSTVPLTQKALQINGGFVVAYGNTNTVRMTGNWNVGGNLVVFSSSTSTTEASARVFDTNGYTLTVNGNLTLGNTLPGYTNNYYAKLLLKNGTHRITGNIAPESATEGHSYLELGSGTVLVGGSMDFRNITVRPQTSTVILNKTSGTGSINSGTGAAYSVFHNLTQSGAGTWTVSGSHLQIGNNLTLPSGAGKFDAAKYDKNITVLGNVTMDNTQTDMGDGTWTVSGNFDNKDVTTMNVNNSVLHMIGTGTLTAKPYLANLTIGTGATVNLGWYYLSGPYKNLHIYGTLDTGAWGGMPSGSKIYIHAGGEVRGVSFIPYNCSPGYGILELNGLFNTDLEIRHDLGGTYVPGTYNGDWMLSSFSFGTMDWTTRLSSGTYRINGNLTLYNNDETNNLTIDNATNDPNLILTGSLIYSRLGAAPITWTKGDGMLTFSGSKVQAINPFGQAIDDITINKTGGSAIFTGTGTLNSLDVTQGTVDFNGKEITTIGDVSIGVLGQVNPRGLPGSAITVGGNLSLTGESADKLNLSATGAWTLNVTGTAAASHVTVRNSDASGGNTVVATNSTDGGANRNWAFERTVVGTLYSDEGSTPLAGKKISLSLGGRAVSGSGVTDAGGQYVINLTAVMTGGTIVTLFVDDATEDAVTVVLGSGGSMTGVSLYQNRLIVMSQSGSAAVTNAQLDTANNSGDSDIAAIYGVTGGNLTVATGKELLVWTGDAFAPGGTVTADDYDINGTLTLGANAFTVNGSFDATGGSFTSTGTGTFAATSAGKTLKSDGSSFQNIKFNGVGGEWTLQDALNVGGTLTVTNGIVDTNAAGNYAVTVAGTFDQSSTTSRFNANASVITLSGNGNFTADGTIDATQYNDASLVLNGV